MPDSRQRNLILVIKRVLRSPLSVTVVGLWLLFALMRPDLVHYLLGGLAVVVVIGAYAISKLNSESFIRETINEERERQRKEDLTDRTFRIEELDIESRVKMKTIVKLQSEIAEDVANSPIDEVAAGLSDTVDKTDELVERGLVMARQHSDLQRYLNRTDSDAIVARISGLEARRQAEQDPARQAEITASLASKQKELEDYNAIKQASGRILDQLDAIECSFSELRARLVRIKSTNIADWVAANTELQTELGGLSSSVGNLEQSINEVLLLGNAGQ